MNVREAADYLTTNGFRCRAGTVRGLVKAGLLKCFRGPSGRGPMQFPATALDRFLQDGLVSGAPKAAGSAAPEKPARREKAPKPVAKSEPGWREEMREVVGK